MNGVHDMGGMHGFGPIEIEADEPVFHEDWEGRVYGIVTGIREEHDVYGPYGSRHYIENIPPAHYLASSYYEKWMLALEAALLNKGLLTAEELDARTRSIQPMTRPPKWRGETMQDLRSVCGGASFSHSLSNSRPHRLRALPLATQLWCVTFILSGIRACLDMCEGSAA